MAIVSRKKNEIQCKVVYYGPGRGGKTTNLITIHKAVASKVRGQLISIHTAGDRTIFFDFMPMDLGTVKNMNIKISVYTVPGQVIYNDTRKVVLRGVDGIVFVADSLEIRQTHNIESMSNLEDNLRDLGRQLSDVPLVLQYNKRDLNGSSRLMSIKQLEEDLNSDRLYKSFPASALVGNGVKETFKQICMMTVASVCKQFL
jgi:signal recognition particle receptor subunit beta